VLLIGSIRFAAIALILIRLKGVAESLSAVLFASEILTTHEATVDVHIR
jgi:hypothetical protein